MKCAVAAVRVQELHLPRLPFRTERNFSPALKGPVDHVCRPNARRPQLGAYERAALARLDVLEVHDLEDRAVDGRCDCRS